MGPTTLVHLSEIRGLEPQPTIEQLIDRAYVAVVLRIVSIESGMDSLGGLGSRVRGEIVQLLHAAEGLLEKGLVAQEGAIVEYATSEYWIEFDGMTLCAKRPENTGFLREKGGDFVLLLGTPRTPNRYYVNKVFPVVDEVVQAQPYEFVVQQTFVLAGASSDG